MVWTIEFVRSDCMKKTRRLPGRFCVAAMCMLVPQLAGGCTESLREECMQNSMAGCLELDNACIIGIVRTAVQCAVEDRVEGFCDPLRAAAD